MSKALAGTALGLSIAAFLIGWFPIIGWLLWISAFIVAVVAVVKCRTKEQGKSMAIAALVIMIISMILIPALVFTIGLLSYVGVSSSDNFLPNSCSLGSEFMCQESRLLADNTFMLGVQNNFGSTIEGNITLLDPNSNEVLCGGTQSFSQVNNGALLNDGRFEFSCLESELSSNERLRANIVIEFNSQDPQDLHIHEGSVQVRRFR